MRLVLAASCGDDLPRLPPRAAPLTGWEVPYKVWRSPWIGNVSSVDDETPFSPSGGGEAVEVEALQGLEDLGYLGVWSVSSAKQGNGVASLRDGDLTTTWQSDGHVPHTITVTFQKRVHVVALRVYMDYGLDESYTPLRASVKVGTSGAPHDVSITLKAEWDEPRGWQTLWLGGKPDGSFPDATSHQHRPAGMCLWRLEIDLLQNHQNGRDSHVRQIQVLGPRGDSAGAPMTLLPLATTALATLQQRMEAPGRWSGLGRTGDEGRWEASTVPSHRRPPPPPSDTSATLARQFRSIR